MAGNFTLDKPQNCEFFTKGAQKVTAFRATSGSEFFEKMERFFTKAKIAEVVSMVQSESNGYTTLVIVYREWPDDVPYKENVTA